MLFLWKNPLLFSSFYNARKKYVPSLPFPFTKLIYLWVWWALLNSEFKQKCLLLSGLLVMVKVVPKNEVKSVLLMMKNPKADISEKCFSIKIRTWGFEVTTISFVNKHNKVLWQQRPVFHAPAQCPLFFQLAWWQHCQRVVRAFNNFLTEKRKENNFLSLLQQQPLPWNLPCKIFKFRRVLLFLCRPNIFFVKLALQWSKVKNSKWRRHLWESAKDSNHSQTSQHCEANQVHKNIGCPFV